MHAYDPIRHTWRYDIGGFAWDNTELASNMWLWYNFLRTGRVDIWRRGYDPPHSRGRRLPHRGECRIG